jgi:formaldehyde-activating enzyme
LKLLKRIVSKNINPIKYINKWEVVGMYLSGEARVGDEVEVAHIDLLIGDKEGPVGQAFAGALANQMEKHTPLFAIIAPNLTTKPVTLISPKVSLRRKGDVLRIFGPAQKGVAMAVAECVEEETIHEDIVEDICIICSVFIHPGATDYNKIYKNNYEAAKLAIQRAFTKEPSIDEILSERNSVVHPLYKGP